MKIEAPEREPWEDFQDELFPMVAEYLRLTDKESLIGVMECVIQNLREIDEDLRE